MIPCNTSSSSLVLSNSSNNAMINPHALPPPLHHALARALGLVLQVRLNLCIQRVLLARHLEVERRLLIADDVLLQARVAGAGGFDGQLDGAAAVEEAKEEAGFVDCRAG